MIARRRVISSDDSMILPDVNVLVYPFRREAAQHEAYSGWLAAPVSGTEEGVGYSTPAGRMVAGIFATLAQLEQEQDERARRG